LIKLQHMTLLITWRPDLLAGDVLKTFQRRGQAVESPQLATARSLLSQLLRVRVGELGRRCER
jgi:hypothetical protein